MATILDDVGSQPGSLPLLEHALLELWERRRGGLLTLAGYQQTGGVRLPLAERADLVLASLDEAAQDDVRRTLLRLTQPGEGALGVVEAGDRHAALVSLVGQGDAVVPSASGASVGKV